MRPVHFQDARAELFTQQWDMPVQKIATTFGISAEDVNAVVEISTSVRAGH